MRSGILLFSIVISLPFSEHRSKEMDDNDEEDYILTRDSIIPQSRINAVFQSNTEKGIRKLCCELLDLKNAVENLHGNTRSKFMAFLRLSEEVLEIGNELDELKKHICTQGLLVKDMRNGVCMELEEWANKSDEIGLYGEYPKIDDHKHNFMNEMDTHATYFENIDMLLAEHKVDEALEALNELYKILPELITDESSLRTALGERKELLGDQLVGMAEEPFVSYIKLKKALVALQKLGKGFVAHQIMLKSHRSHLHKRIQAFILSCKPCPNTCSDTLLKLVFSSISFASRESNSIFGDDPIYFNKIVQWSEWEIESFVRLVKENVPSSELASSLRAACTCLHTSFDHCVLLEQQGLKLSKLLIVLLSPYVEEVLDLNFRRAGRVIFDFAGNVEIPSLPPSFASPLYAIVESSDKLVVESGIRFLALVKDVVDQFTPHAVMHFGEKVLVKILQLFDKHIDVFIKAIPGPSEDDSPVKELSPFSVETDLQQLSLLGVACIISDNLSPEILYGFWIGENEKEDQKHGSVENFIPSSNTIMEYREWKRHLIHSFDRLRDHFCRQYVLNFIYQEDGKARLDALIYLNSKRKEIMWNSDPLPSLPFQALFSKLQQLATETEEVLLGRDKIRKSLLSRVTETVVIWLSDEHDFWCMFEDDSSQLHPIGLLQLILDMHFIIEIARFAGYPSRHLHQIISSIIARAVRTFSTRGVDPQTVLPDDSWFSEAAKLAIDKLLPGTSGPDTPVTETGHIFTHGDDTSDSGESPSSLSSSDSFKSFVSATMDLEIPAFPYAEG